MHTRPLLHARCAAAFGTGALSFALAFATTAQAADAPLPTLQTAGALQYACGGIGSDESTAMRSAMKDYPLSLLFARKDGEYLANLAVQIQGAQGEAMSFTAAGPVCLLKLPRGHYSVKATTQGGESQSKSVDVGRNGHTLDFRY